MECDMAPTKVNCDIVILSKEISKVVLDQLPLVPAANNEIVQSGGFINFHDVPKDRF
jgi:hypothetical protein